MRTWIWIVAVGLLMVGAGIWVIASREALFPWLRGDATAGAGSVSPQGAAAGRPEAGASNEDPLVPPARVPGLLPPAAVWPGDVDPGDVDPGDVDPGDVDPGDVDPGEGHPGEFLRLVSFGGGFAHDDRAFFHPHGHDVCPSGCAASRHPTGDLTGPLFRQLMAQFAREPIDETSPAFETLLYYGRQAKKFVDLLGTSPLDPARADALRRELCRTHARISIRVLDEQGAARTWLRPTRVPLDRRHVFEMETDRVQALETSGTVKRVGLYHLWNRL